MASLIDNDPNWMVTPPKFRRLLLLTGWAAMIVWPFLVVYLGYNISPGAAAVYATLASWVGAMGCIYTYNRGTQDKTVMSQLDPNTMTKVLMDIVKNKMAGGYYGNDYEDDEYSGRHRGSRNYATADQAPVPEDLAEELKDITGETPNK